MHSAVLPADNHHFLKKQPHSTSYQSWHWIYNWTHEPYKTARRAVALILFHREAGISYAAVVILICGFLARAGTPVSCCCST